VSPDRHTMSKRPVAVVCTALVLLAATLTYMSHRDASGRVDQVEQLMVAQARAVSAIIAASSVHGLETYTLYQKELSRLQTEIARSRDSYDVAASLSASLESARVNAGPGHLIRSLGECRSVRYVVIQNEYGILAASAGVTGFPAPGDDPALRPLAEGAELVTREYPSPVGDVYEVSRIMSLGGPGDVLLRIGLDNTFLVNSRNDIRRRTIMRAIVLLFSIVLASTLLMAWQRQITLGREVLRVEAELLAKEDEARRAEKLVAMGALAAGVAHQVRNPLNSIHMIAQRVARRKDTAEETRTQASLIMSESARIEAIVQQFLDFATPRHPHPEPLTLGDVVRATVATAEAAGDGDDIRYVTEFGDVPIELDRGFVVEIMENLLRNALAALDGKGTVRIVVRREADQGLIVLEDDGPGVAKENRKRIFDLYFTTRPDGTGLGLSLVAQMISAMGGTITVGAAHTFPSGARFEIRFPLQGAKK
jgi:signal transduction histidine kinase